MEAMVPVIASNLAEVEATCRDALSRQKEPLSDLALQGIAGQCRVVAPSALAVEPLAAVIFEGALPISPQTLLFP